MGKAFTGNSSNYGSPSEKAKPSDKVSFKQEGAGLAKSNPLSGVGSDSRPRIDDNKPGKNRWPMGEGKVIDGDKNRYGNNKSFGPGPKGMD